MCDIDAKEKKLEELLKGLGRAVVAFSAGVDSTFLLKKAHDVLGEGVIAVTARSCSYSKRELDEAIAFCKENGIRHVVCDSEELSIEGFAKNPKNRCYLCKKELFTKLKAIAEENLTEYVIKGSNADDEGDYRPGLMAIAELGIISPLREVGLNKNEIRTLSRKSGLKTWDKQSFACLSSRFVYGESITEDKLKMIDKAEQRLIDMGLRQVRVRIHGELARIEVEPCDFNKLISAADELNAYLKSQGFKYVTMDLGGYRMGSMNDTL